MSDKNKLNRTDLYTHVYSSGSMYSCCSWSAAKRRRLRVRGCLQLTWLGELVRTFSSEPGTRGPGHHDAMTEAPGRKNDCHFSSVPGARGRTAKIGEVFSAEAALSQGGDACGEPVLVETVPGPLAWGGPRLASRCVGGFGALVLYPLCDAQADGTEYVSGSGSAGFP